MLNLIFNIFGLNILFSFLATFCDILKNVEIVLEGALALLTSRKLQLSLMLRNLE